MEEDLYEVLCISRDASGAEIRKAYKKMALIYHPDKVPAAERADAEVRFKIISEAYETLINPETRAQYDQFGHSTQNGGQWQDYYDPGFGPDAFAEFFGFNGPSHARRTANAEFEIELKYEEIYVGKVLKLSSVRQVICKQCTGTGGRSKAKPKVCGKCEGSGMIEKLRPLGHGLMTANRVPCDACNGKGSLYRTRDLCKRCNGKTTVEEKAVLEVYVPRGVPDGHQIVFKGRADEATGKETGDIIVTVQILDHPVFTRQGQDLYTKVMVSLQEALTGFSRVLVKHLDGRGLKITVPRGHVSTPGSILKIRNEGMPMHKSDQRGDLYIQVDIDFPQRLDQELVDALSKVLPPVNFGPKFTGDIEPVDHKVVSASDLPEYKSTSGSSEDGSSPGCAQM